MWPSQTLLVVLLDVIKYSDFHSQFDRDAAFLYLNPKTAAVLEAETLKQ